MSDQDNVFGNEPMEPEAPTQPATPAPDQDKVVYNELLATITNKEGTQKFDSVTKALASIAPAQEHIATLEQELATLREQQQKNLTAEQALEQIKAQQTNQQTAAPNGVTLDEVAKLMETTLARKQEMETAETNVRTVNDALVEQFGSVEKAVEQLKTKASELGLSVDTAKDIAAKSPSAVLAWFPKAPGVANSAPKSSVNSEVLNIPATTTEDPSVYKGIMGPTGNVQAAWEDSAKRVKERLGVT